MKIFNYINNAEVYLNNFLKEDELYELVYDPSMLSYMFRFRKEHNNRVYYDLIPMYKPDPEHIIEYIFNIRRNIIEFSDILDTKDLIKFYCYYNEFDNFKTKAFMLSMDNKKVKELFLDYSNNNGTRDVINSYKQYVIKEINDLK